MAGCLHPPESLVRTTKIGIVRCNDCGELAVCPHPHGLIRENCAHIAVTCTLCWGLIPVLNSPAPVVVPYAYPRLHPAT